MATLRCRQCDNPLNEDGICVIHDGGGILMRPRTATIQVAQSVTKDLWIVQIGDSKAAIPSVNITDESLEDALILAVVQWKEKEGLGD